MDAISAPIRTLLDLFAAHLGEVRFGDVDAKTLARVAADVQAAAAVVASAQAALEAARDTLHDRQEALLGQSLRAVAYARVYAEGDLALAEKLDAIVLPRMARKAKAAGDTLVPASASTGGREGEREEARRPRGRPRKASAPAPDALLFNGE
jgi:hypothetical protein